MNIKFYASTENGKKYTGWEKLKVDNWLSYRSWLLSENYLVIDDMEYNKYSIVRLYRKIFETEEERSWRDGQVTA